MKKTTFFAGIVVLSFLMIPGVAETSNDAEATVFPTKIIVNNQELALPAGYPVLNYRGKAYVPVRDFVEGTGGVLSYEADKAKIEINTPSIPSKKSELSSLTRQNDFALSLYSSKQTYKSNEVMDIWGVFQYTGENDAELGHGNPILAFYMKDSSGHYVSDITKASLVKENIKPNTLITAPYPLDRNSDMNYLISGNQDWDEFQKAYPKPWLLPKGKYTVGVTFRHLIDGEEVELSTELDIEME